MSLSERFWSKVKITSPTGCWLWCGSHPHTTGRYGMIAVKGKYIMAHRVAWELTNGTIPTGMLVCHKCDVPPCVNPSHLFLGTPKDNVRDCIQKGRFNSTNRAKGVDCFLAKLNDESVKKIREDYHSGCATADEIAKRFGVSQSTISSLVRGRTWKHAGGPISKPRRRILSREEVDRIFHQKNQLGMSQTKIAMGLGVQPSCVSNILNGKNHRRLQPLNPVLHDV